MVSGVFTTSDSAVLQPGSFGKWEGMIGMDIHAKLLTAAAADLGISVTDLSDEWQMDVMRFQWKDKTELVFEGGISMPGLSHKAFAIARNKHASKALFRELDIPAPAGLTFHNAIEERAALERFLDQYAPVVCKPLDAAEGDGIRMNIYTFQEVAEHWEALHQRYQPMMLEQQVKGEDLRIHIIDGEPVAACRRIPAEVIGNGTSTIAQLIEQKNIEVTRINPDNGIDIDQQLHKLLASQDLNLETVVEAERRVALKTIANMSQGARAVDVTHSFHPDYAKWAARVAEALETRFVSLDVITTDHTAPPAENAVALEINGESAWVHHTFSEGKQHPMAHMILKALFHMP